MKKTEEEIISSEILLVKQIKGIIKSEISAIDDKGNSKKQTEKDPVEELVRVTSLVTAKNYLFFYNKIVNFLYSKLEDNSPDEDFFFYIPLLRTLIEIYAYLLFFCFQDKNKQAAISIATALNTIAKLDTEEVSQKIMESYTKYYSSYKDLIDKKKISIPTDPALNSNRWLKESGYGFPPVEQMLKEEWINESSPQISYAKGGVAEDIYKVYRGLSNYVHGNILSKDHHGNEKIWIIAQTMALSFRVTELINVKMLDNSKKKEIGSCLAEFTRSSASFKDMWQKRKTNQSK